LTNELIQSKIGKKVEYFAYPFGSKNEVGKREFEIVKKLGFKTATTTRNGNILKNIAIFLNLFQGLCLQKILILKILVELEEKE